MSFASFVLFNKINASITSNAQNIVITWRVGWRCESDESKALL